MRLFYFYFKSVLITFITFVDGLKRDLTFGRGIICNSWNILNMNLGWRIENEYNLKFRRMPQ